ncbi:MAG: PD40 domain-containing protein [Candidatus Wallbacteria bacterium]|nr:PD40 domain-containing protein [Candidatus Wallbacteria bacterium]
MRARRASTFGGLLVGVAFALAVATPSEAFFRHPTSDDLLSPPDRTCTQPAPSPDGRAVAFVVEDTGLKQIWLRTAGKPPVDRKLSDGQSNDEAPDWSADGGRLYYTSDRAGGSKIWVLEISTGARRQVTTADGQDFHPRVSPSGRWLAYDSNRSGNFEIWVRDLAGGTERKLTSHSASDFSPCWSPRDDELAFTSSRGGAFNVWIQDAQGKREARPFTNGKGGSAHPDWSPDGRAIAYDSDRGGTTKIWVQPVSGASEPLALTDLLSVEERPRFMRSGRKIFFQAKENQLAGFKSRPAPAMPATAASRATPGAGPLAAIGAAPEPPAAAGTPRPAFRGNRPAGGGLTVLQFFPVTQDGGCEVTSPVGVVLDKPLAPRQNLKSRVKLWESTGEMTLEVSYNPSLRRLEVLPDLPLRPGTQYKVALSKELRARDGSTLGHTFVWGFTTRARALASAEPPPQPTMHVGRLQTSFTLSNVTPAPRSGSIAAGAKIVAHFSLPIDPKSLDVNALRLYHAAGKQVPGELFFPPGDYTLQLTPYEPLEPGAVYEARISGKLKSQEGIQLTGSASWKFRTAFSGPLRVVQIQPDRFLPEHPVIRLRFNRPLSRMSVGSGKVALQGAQFPYPGAVTLASGNEVLVFEPYQKLPDKQQFVLVLPVDLSDPDGNALELAGPITFTSDHQAAAKVRSKPEPAKRAPVSMASAGSPAIRSSSPGSDPLGRYLGAVGSLSANAEGWMVGDLKALARKGHLPADFDEALQRQGGTLSRHKCALYVHEALGAFPYMKAPERQRLQRLTSALGQELASLGIRPGRAVAGHAAQDPPSPRKPGPGPADLDFSG